jgi:signal transduction histidine kinase
VRPLDFLGRIKAKLGLVILLAVATAFSINEYGRSLGVVASVRMGIAAILSLGMVQLLGRGMIRPLREMAAAAQTIAKGRYGMRVRATSRDEVGELARAFNAMAADLGEVDRQRRELIANVSHELRTPITGLQAVLENIVDGVSAPDLATLGTALNQTERLGRLVAQLLDLSRLDSGARPIEPELVELGALCGQAVREASLARDDVSVSSAVSPRLGLHADPALLGQVLANLLDNGVRHSPPGGLVRLEARPEGPGVRLSVIDQGPGIPEPERPRVFERFSRLDSARAADAGGAGLGLAIVKEIVELHGGSIWVADSPAGCHMVVDLPGRATAMNDVPSEPLPAMDGPFPGPEGRAREAGRTAGVPAERGPDDDLRRAAEVADEPAQARSEPVHVRSEPVHTRGEPVHVRSEPVDTRGEPVDTRSGSPQAHGEPVDAVIVEDAAGRGHAGAARGPATLQDAGAGPDTMVSSARLLEYRPGGPSGWGRGVAGGLLGLVCGFVVGLCVAFFMGLFFGGLYGLVTMLLVTVGGSVLGAALGSSSARPVAAPVSQGAYRPPTDYVPPPLLPRPDLPETPRWLPLAAAAVGLLAAVALPFSGPGLGIVLVAVAVGSAVLPAARHRITPWTVAFGLLAYALVAVALFRDAGWLVVPMLPAGFGLAALAVSGGGRGWLGVIRGGLSVVLAVLPLPWFLMAPLKGMNRNRRLAPLLAGIGLAAVLIVVFGVLFASADAVFSSFVSRLFTTPEWASSLPFRLLVFAVFAALVGAATLVALRPPVEPITLGLRRQASRTVWLTPLVALNMLFASFVAVQITTLFGGNRKVVETAGLTYAQYARSGFFELVTASVFVLGIVAVAAGVLAPKGRERWALAGLLGLLCAFTLVVLASALHRLGLYIEAYGLSRMRASVGAAIWWMAAIFALVLVAGGLRLAGRKENWLPRTLVAVTGLSLVVFAAWNPDLRVAETQIHMRGVNRLDVDYLSDLGAEAVPVVDGLPEPARTCLLMRMSIVDRLKDSESWNGWNLARQNARDLLRARPLREPLPQTCEDIGSPGT